MALILLTEVSLRQSNRFGKSCCFLLSERHVVSTFGTLCRQASMAYANAYAEIANMRVGVDVK